ncbi:MBL fold metallo-hydrolase [Candidatus Woesearchaeota archaeon]|nr:MBL fold metallo-hydrolase [Candidatus Woesearchaeota archaeon]
MGIEICAVGGFSEVGKNCLAVNVDGDVVIIDMGLQMDKYIEYTDEENVFDFSVKKLTSIGAIPDIKNISDWQNKVVAIIPSHAHLDHMGAIPFLASSFPGIVLCTPFTKAVLEAIIHDDKRHIRNQIKSLLPNSSYKLSDKITVEFVYMTHSTPQTVTVVLHTKYGAVVYTNDFKLDSKPTLGQKANIKRLTELGKQGVLCVVLDCLYCKEAKKCPSENVAKEMLREVLLDVDASGKAIIVTTFSSHLARLKSIIECGKKLKRKVIFLGRSLSKYVYAGEQVGIIQFSHGVKIIKFKDKMAKVLKQVDQNRDQYLIVCTGHQGEPKSVLSKIISKDFPFTVRQGDHIIFSCTTIPAEVNIRNREVMEEKLRALGARIFKDIHVSGHGAREDHRELLRILQPRHLIPGHGHQQIVAPIAELVAEMKQELDADLHFMKNGQRIRIG